MFAFNEVNINSDGETMRRKFLFSRRVSKIL